MVYKSLCLTKNKSQCWHTVIPGQDQVSYSFQAGCCKYSDIRTKEHKNADEVHSSVRPWASSFPHCHMSIIQKVCSASTAFLKRQRKLMFILTKELKTQRCKCRHWRIWIYIKSIWMDVKFLNAYLLFLCSCVLKKRLHPLNKHSANDSSSLARPWTSFNAYTNASDKKNAS